MTKVKLKSVFLHLATLGGKERWFAGDQRSASFGALVDLLCRASGSGDSGRRAPRVQGTIATPGALKA